MHRFPALPRAPNFGAALHGAAARAGLDRTDDMHGFASCLQRGDHARHVIRGDRQNHADPAIKGARHFGRFDVALRLQERHQARLFPCARINPGMQALGQDPRDILQKAAPGNMGQGVNFGRFSAIWSDQRQQAFDVNPGRGDQMVDQQPVWIEHGRAIHFPALVGRQPPHQ